jgi:hypothetical protein
MPTNVLFISEKYYRENSLINENVDSKYLTSTILFAQESNIMRILGTALYNELQSQIATNTVTTLNETLLDEYIAPCLVEYVTAELIPHLNYKYTNKNVSTKNSEYSNAVSLSEIKYLEEKHRNRAEYYAERITRYLMQNANLYPLYNNAGSGIDVVHPVKDNYRSNIVFGKGSNCEKYKDL